MLQFLDVFGLKTCGKSMRFLDDFWMIFGDPVFRHVQIKPIIWAFCKFPPPLGMIGSCFSGCTTVSRCQSEVD